MITVIETDAYSCAGPARGLCHGVQFARAARPGLLYQNVFAVAGRAFGDGGQQVVGGADHDRIYIFTCDGGLPVCGDVRAMALGQRFGFGGVHVTADSDGSPALEAVRPLVSDKAATDNRDL